MDNEFIDLGNVDYAESILEIPLFSYFMVLDEKGNNILSYSFEFSNPESCETFYSTFNAESNSIYRLKTITMIINNLLNRRLLKKQVNNSNYIEFTEPPLYIALLHYHDINFIAIYSELTDSISENQKEFIKGSLQGIASTFIALHVNNEQELQQPTKQSETDFLESIPVILYQNLKHGRNCRFCPPDKNCLPKLLLKKEDKIL